MMTLNALVYLLIIGLVQDFDKVMTFRNFVRFFVQPLLVCGIVMGFIPKFEEALMTLYKPSNTPDGLSVACLKSDVCLVFRDHDIRLIDCESQENLALDDMKHVKLQGLSEVSFVLSFFIICPPIRSLLINNRVYTFFEDSQITDRPYLKTLMNA